MRLLYLLTWLVVILLANSILLPAQSSSDPQALYKLGLRLFSTSEFKKADSVVLLYLKSKGSLRDTLYAEGASLLGQSLAAQSRYAKAEPYDRTALEIYENTTGSRSSNYVRLLSNLAHTIHYQGRYTEAESMFRKAVEIRKVLTGTIHPEYAESLNNLAFNLNDQGRYTQAEPLGREAMEIYKKTLGTRHPDYALSLNNLAFNLRSQGRYPEAELLCREMVEIYKEVLGVKHPDYARSLNSLAQTVELQGRYSEAEPLHREALTIRKSALGSRHPAYARSVTNLAMNLYYQGRYAETESLLKEALEITKEVLGEKHPNYIGNLVNLATDLDAQERYTEAETLYRQALTSIKIESNAKSRGLGNALNNLAANLTFQKRYSEAELLYREAVETYKEVLSLRHPDYALSLNNLANNLYNQGRYTEAEPLFQQSLEIYEAVLGTRNLRYGLGLRNLASLFEAQGSLDKAEPLYQRGIEVYFDHYSANQAALSEAQRQKLYDTYLGRYYRSELRRYALHPNPANTDYAWNWHLNLRGLQLQTSVRLRALVAVTGDTVLEKTYQSWRNQREYLSILYNLSKNDLSQRNINLTTEESKATELERLINQRSVAFRQANDTTRIAWRQIANLLGPNEGIADIVRFSTDSTAGYLVFLYRHGWPEPKTVVLNDAGWLEQEGLALYRSNVFTTEQSLEIFKRFWAPIDSCVGRPRKLYLAVDGVYNQVNINTFQYPTGGYIIDKTEIVQVGSFRDLVLPTSRPVTADAITAVGRPAYSLDAPTFEKLFLRGNSLRGGVIDLVGSQWSDLPNTEPEVRAITKIFASKHYTTALWLGTEATETAVKQVNQPRVLHIATHGFFVPKPADAVDQENGKLIFFRGGGKQNSNANAYNFERDPLLRSGLVLAGASNAATETRQLKEDGILTAYEAGTLNLQGTELVVLSACETGLGELQPGEGIYGLQRSMQLAGAKSVITSLWWVDDIATQELMTKFYHLWLKGKTKRVAFVKAQLAIRKKYPEPVFWGAFVLIGE
ncbi:MAG: CHAT domain-containing protein [Cyclobacteriaceae bacterium]|nr:CHAT domain-containing protein [Cyclobacteriaceae bacterium]